MGWLPGETCPPLFLSLSVFLLTLFECVSISSRIPRWVYSVTLVVGVSGVLGRLTLWLKFFIHPKNLVDQKYFLRIVQFSKKKKVEPNFFGSKALLFANLQIHLLPLGRHMFCPSLFASAQLWLMVNLSQRWVTFLTSHQQWIKLASPSNPILSFSDPHGPVCWLGGLIKMVAMTNPFFSVLGRRPR